VCLSVGVDWLIALLWQHVVKANPFPLVIS
jgi:hypothetical protein